MSCASENREDSPRDKLSLLLEREENQTCADCTEPHPTWASTNWGAFICTQCAGVHRSVLHTGREGVAKEWCVNTFPQLAPPPAPCSQY